MKRIFTLMFAAMLAGQAWAQTTFEVGNLKYTIIEGTTNVSVSSGSTAPTGKLEIPSTVNYDGATYTVTGIDKNAFSNCSGITAVTIPNSVTSCGSGAFLGCGMTTITIPESITNISYQTFRNCSSLTSVTLPNTVTTIGGYAFCDCKNLTTINIPNSVTVISERAFMSCSKLASINIPVGVTSIGDVAFYGCSSLTSVTIPGSVTRIGASSFEGCKGLSSVKILSGVETIGYKAFYNCSGLTSITIPESVANVGYSVLYGCKNVTIYCEAENKPDGWSSDWNDNGGEIEWNANLSEQNEQNTQNEPNEQNTQNNESYKDFEFRFSSSSDGDFAMLKKYKGNANTVSVPDTVYTDSINYRVTYIDNEAFAGSSVKHVNLPSGLKGIGSMAFKNCTALESISIPDSVNSISEAAFYGCSGLKSIALGKSVKTIGMSAFEKSGLELLALPKNIERISNFAFAKCDSLKLVYIPETVTKNDANAFANCTNATIYCAATSQPETWSDMWNEKGGTVVWGKQAPDANTLELTFATNQNGTAAVTGCNTEAESIDIPTMVMVGGSTYFVTSISGKPFYICGNLNSINVGNENLFLASENGILFNKEKNVLLACPPRKTGAYTIPNTVVYIGDAAFFCCRILQSIEIPNSVTEIGGVAFSGCEGLTSINIPNSVTSIGGMAFGGCSGITEITIPKSVVSMGAQIFETFNEEKDTVITITVYCEVSEQPEDWDELWSYCGNVSKTKVNLIVVWAKEDEDEDEDDHTPITESAANAVSIYAHGNTIVVENATTEISVYDAMGRLIVRRDDVYIVSTEIRMNTAGIYIVKVGNVAKRVMVND